MSIKPVVLNGYTSQSYKQTMDNKMQQALDYVRNQTPEQKEAAKAEALARIAKQNAEQATTQADTFKNLGLSALADQQDQIDHVAKETSNTAHRAKQLAYIKANKKGMQEVKRAELDVKAAEAAYKETLEASAKTLEETAAKQRKASSKDAKDTLKGVLGAAKKHPVITAIVVAVPVVAAAVYGVKKVNENKAQKA